MLHTGPHGGDWRKLALLSGRNEEDILDFSVNVRPEGPPDFLRGALLRALDVCSRYPSPECLEACEAAARFHGVSPGHFVFGNGCNQLIHDLPRLLHAPEVLVLQPSFGEYVPAWERAGKTVRSCGAGADLSFLPVWEELATAAPAGGAVLLASPGNPSGVLLPKGAVLEAARRRRDVWWIVDEAFVDYVGEEYSLVGDAAREPNVIVLRSLTKFYGLAGIRAGYAAAPEVLAERWRRELPPWSVNALAAAAACAALGDQTGFVDEERRQNTARREQLASMLHTLPGVHVYPSSANYLLLRLPDAPEDFALRLLKKEGIAVRDCSNYAGLETGGWYRVAVRGEHDNIRLAEALARCLRENAFSCAPALMRHRVPALMLQGTSSDAGKSILASAFCRILRQDGYDVAPFKAQNMALNSGVTPFGDEMGRAQIVQAAACRLDPDARMNPVLLKPHSDTGSQIVVLGHPQGSRDARDFMRSKRDLWPVVCEAYDTLASEHEVMVLEGAGSPGEVNLKAADIVNMNMARHAGASVMLVGDIDRGGVYASFLGTWQTFTAAEKRLLRGFLVNRFRGDASLLDPAHDYMRRMTGVPVLGVVPMLRDLQLPEEDRASFAWENGREKMRDCLDVAVVMPGHVSNFTDFAPLAAEPDVRLRTVRTREEWGQPDLVILPGSKNVPGDFGALGALGLDEAVRNHAGQGKWTLGVCGGLQMLGRTIFDPLHVETESDETAMLGLLDLETKLAGDKTLAQVRGARTPLGVTASGYEIHHGVTRAGEACEALFFRPDGTPCGYGQGRIWATYLHGLFDDDAFRRAFIDHVREDVGLAPAGRVLYRHDLEDQLDRLAESVRAAVDMKAVYRSMGL